jgi:hypothetical protein
MARPHRVLVEAVRLDGETQSRVRIDEEAVSDYAEAIKAGVKLPPIQVCLDGLDYWLWDGFHRVFAMKRLGIVDTNAFVTKGTREDARWLACSANRENGIRRTNADKRKAVEMALKARPKESDRSIAEHCGVHHTTVAAVRGGSTGEISQSYPDVTERTGRDGRTIDTANIGRKRVVPDLPTGVDPASYSAPRQEREEPTDALGQPIPESIRAKYREAKEWADGWLHRCSGLARELTTLMDADDARLVSVTRSTIDSAFERIRFEIREKAKPHAVCLMCSAAGCRACARRGWMSEAQFRTVPTELRPSKKEKSHG